MIQFPYDKSYVPPVPACRVSLVATQTGQTVGPLDAILDTGADGTLVPRHYLEAIEVLPVRKVGIRSQWGERRIVYLFLVTLRLDDFELPGTYVVGDDKSQELIIGRNVLNRLDIWLQGDRQLSHLAVSHG
ncbi:hypothetical protein [Candidatus Amarolinea aalborgensis]|jgi:predicted aspartyl protease|uniref:hypothetical protein n=1 Tax=Candidatus Amarolinea aalborgensis TaxID=2249329 RepID=UPI003BFA09B7